MRIVKKNVYYCDFCKKKGLRSVLHHESRCTANPNRQCGVCEGNDIGEIVKQLTPRFEIVTVILNEGLGDFDTLKCNWVGEKITLSEIINITDGCPACTLAVLRQSKLNYEVCGLEKYDFKKELEIAMKGNYTNPEAGRYYN